MIDELTGLDVIAIADLGRVFYTEDVETHSLAGVNLTVKPGEFVAISGPSGSGKTTLLAILGLLDRPSTGTYALNGKPVERMAPDELAQVRSAQIGFIFQTFNLIGDMTVQENVELPLVYRSVARDERRERAARALERVGMTHRSRHMPGQLSGGQQQRVAVARAIVGDPSVLLADEPTGNLDSTNGEMIMALIAELHAAGSTICMVTHDPLFARKASRRLHLFDGRIVSDDA